MNIHHDLESIKMVAVELAKEHGCNYNIILFNPNHSGEFDLDCGSTYEYVADSYFEKPRPNVLRLHTTDELIALEPPKKGSFADVYPDEYKNRLENKPFVISNPYNVAPTTATQGYEHEYISNGHSGKPYVRPEPKIGRNESCHCGSGKKLKKCCKQ